MADKKLTEDKPEILVVEVYLKSRKFESKIQIPLIGTDQDRESFVDSWFQLMQAGIKVGRNV